jgi:branched-chain amino acid aminotransferase
MSKGLTFRSAELEIIKTMKPKAKENAEKLIFGHSFTDHMLYSEWNEISGWNRIVIKPWENISLAPSATIFHYGVSVLCQFTLVL